MQRSITVDHDLPLRASSLSDDAISRVFGGCGRPHPGGGRGMPCRTNADCCPAPPGAIVPVVCRFFGVPNPMNPWGHCSF
jgi:hypothetical protein